MSKLVPTIATNTDKDSNLTEGLQTFEEAQDQLFAETAPSIAATVVSKSLTPEFGKKDKRRKRLVRNLKRRRSYAKPVKGGTGKQSRTRRNRFK